MIVINTTTFIIIITSVAICHLKAMEFVYRKGSSFYTNSNNICTNNDIWDIIHSNFKDYSIYNYTKNLYTFIFVIPILYNVMFGNISVEFYKEFLLKFVILIFLRSITIIATILPKNSHVETESDEYSNLSLFDKTIGGGCYDKMFSGHFAFGLLLTLLMFKYDIIENSLVNIVFFTIINILHLFILGVTRSHYTMDMIVSLYVTLFVYSLGIKLE